MDVLTTDLFNAPRPAWQPVVQLQRAQIVLLLQEGWTAPQIAAHLDIPPLLVRGVGVEYAVMRMFWLVSASDGYFRLLWLLFAGGVPFADMLTYADLDMPTFQHLWHLAKKQHATGNETSTAR